MISCYNKIKENRIPKRNRPTPGRKSGLEPEDKRELYVLENRMEGGLTRRKII